MKHHLLLAAIVILGTTFNTSPGYTNNKFQNSVTPALPGDSLSKIIPGSGLIYTRSSFEVLFPNQGGGGGGNLPAFPQYDCNEIQDWLVRHDVWQRCKGLSMLSGGLCRQLMGGRVLIPDNYITVEICKTNLPPETTQLNYRSVIQYCKGYCLIPE